MNAIDHTHTTLLNVVVFSNFPENIFENEIRSKLLENRVNVIRVYKPDRTDAAITDVSQADAVLVFIDFMSHPQDELIRKKARAWGKPIIALRRQTSSEWPKLLKTVMPKPKSFGQFLREERESFRITIKDVAEKTRASVADVKAWEADESMPTGSQLSRLRILFHKIVHHPAFRTVPVAENDDAPESLPLGVKQAMHTFMSLTMAGVGEDEILQAMREVHSPDLGNLNQVEDLFNRYVKTDLAPNEFRSWWESHKKAMLAPLPPASSPQPSRPLVLAPPTHIQRFTAFSRRSKEDSELDRDIEKAVGREPIDEEPPPSQVEVLERQLHDAKTMESMYEDELQKAREEHAAEVAVLREQIQKTLQQFNGAQGARAAAEQKHKTELEKARAEVPAEMARLKVEARDALAEARETAITRDKLYVNLAALEEELADVTGARKKAETTVADLRKKLAEAKPGGDGKLDKIAASFKSLYELGVLTRADIAEKLVHHLLGAAPTGEKS